MKKYIILTLLLGLIGCVENYKESKIIGKYTNDVKEVHQYRGPNHDSYTEYVIIAQDPHDGAVTHKYIVSKNIYDSLNIGQGFMVVEKSN
jgi:hypothetical protein